MTPKTLIAFFVALSVILVLRFLAPSFALLKAHGQDESNIIARPDPLFEKTLYQKDPWQCQFEDDFLIPLHKSDWSKSLRVSFVSEFFDQSNHILDAMQANLRDNAHHARFIYLIGNSRKQLGSLKTIMPPETIMDVYYAPGGVTYRHLFAAASLYPETFLIHNADIAVGNLTDLLEACNAETSFDNAALVGSRLDVLRKGATCQEYSGQGSFDTYLTNRKFIDCAFLNNMRFPPFYWGAENVVASQLPKKLIANLCPYWTFAHHHPGKEVASSNSGERAHRTRINSVKNSWAGVKNNDQVLAKICDLGRLHG